MRLYSVIYTHEIVMLGPDSLDEARALARDLEAEVERAGPERFAVVSPLGHYGGHLMLPATWTPDSLVYHDAGQYGADISVKRAQEIVALTAPPPAKEQAC